MSKHSKFYCFCFVGFVCLFVLVGLFRYSNSVKYSTIHLTNNTANLRDSSRYINLIVLIEPIGLKKQIIKKQKQTKTNKQTNETTPPKTNKETQQNNNNNQ